MAKFRNATKLSIAVLIVLGLVAAALSAMAVLQYRGGTAEPASPPDTAGQTASPDVPEEPTQPADTTDPTPEETDALPEETTQPDSGSGLTVVVIGDTYSVDEGTEIWLKEVTESLGWNNVVNLSAAGRGFLASPRQCELEVCASFGGSVDLIVDENPDIVITFGGTADGDNNLASPATTYFETLRGELPDTHIVAISPVTTDSPAPYYLRMHNTTISEAVIAVDGVFIDVGQPGVGDGETLSEEAHASIANLVIEELSGT